MVKRIHILGASGSGTSTLAKALSKELGYRHFDTDDYFWLPTQERFAKQRDVKERQILLKNDLEKYDSWILSGSLCGWGDMFIPYFDLVVFLWIPQDIRMDRLAQREKERYGLDIEPCGRRHESFNEFIQWAAKYDEGGIDIRSKKLHELWLSQLQCPILRLEGNMTVDERVSSVVMSLNPITNRTLNK